MKRKERRTTIRRSFCVLRMNADFWLPDTFIAAGNLKSHSGGRCERRQQTETERCWNIAAESCLCNLARVEPCSVGHDGQAQKTRTRVDFVAAHGGVGNYVRGEAEPCSAIALHIVRNNLQEGGHARPDSGYIGCCTQFTEV